MNRALSPLLALALAGCSADIAGGAAGGGAGEGSATCTADTCAEVVECSNDVPFCLYEDEEELADGCYHCLPGSQCDMRTNGSQDSCASLSCEQGASCKFRVRGKASAQVTCAPFSNCSEIVLRQSAAGHADVLCDEQSGCQVLVAGSGSAAITCGPGARCAVDAESERPFNMTCLASSSCAARGDLSLATVTCAGGTSPTPCPDGTVACGHGCEL